MDKIVSASVLAFEKKMANSDAAMFSGQWANREQSQGWEPIKVQEKSVRGTISNRLKKGEDAAKLNAQVDKANLQRVDTAALPFDADTVKIVFSLRVLGGVHQPSVCNSPSYQKRVENLVQEYSQEQGFEEIASYFAQNLASGRCAWRNRVGAEACEVRVVAENQTFIFNGFDHSLRSFSRTGCKELEALTQLIKNGLDGTSSHTFMTVAIFIKLGAGQEVFPSQELILSESKSTKSKVLYEIQGQAAMHSQKIGNALRTIDVWHPAFEEVGPIAVETYGAVTSRGMAYRTPKETKLDFYTLFDKWVLKDEKPAVEQQHYVMAVLIRGGVFGKAD